MTDITLGSAQVSITIDGVTYERQSTIKISCNDPRTLRLICSPQGYGDGQVLEENLTQPVRLETTFREVDFDMKEKIREAWEKKKRVGFAVLDSESGGFLSAKRAIITSNPRNRTIDENESVFDVGVNLEMTRRNYNESVKSL